MKKKAVRKIFIIIVAILLSIVPLYNIIGRTYAWHIVQPEVINGGIELLFFVVISFSCVLMFKDCRNVLLLITLAILFLSLNGVLIPVVVNYIYIEILFYIGYVIYSNMSNISDRICYIVCGISCWGACAVILSLLGYGKINHMRWLTVVLLMLCLIVDKKRSYTSLIKSFVEYINEVKNKGGYTIFLIIGFIYISLLLFAKTNSAYDYDSLWYGLRPEYVLVGDNSFYDYLGYSCFVYYYPKLMELLYLPISGMNDYSFIIGMNIFVYIFIIYVVYLLLKMKSLKEQTAWIAIIALGSIPAFANIGATAKPDILGCAFVVAAVYFIERYKTTCDLGYAILSFSSLLLCTGTKLTYLLWGGMTFFYVFVVFIYKVKLQDITEKLKYIGTYFLFIPSLVFVGGVHYRTYLLTGYPFYPILIDLFSKFGFNSRNGLRNTSLVIPKANLDLRGIIHKLYEIVFSPNNLPHVIMLWTSNVLLLVFVVFLFQKEKSYIKKTEKIFPIIIFLIMIYHMIVTENPDGNVYIYPIIICTVFLYSRVKWGNKIISSVIFLPLIVSNIVICMVSHPSWAYGTHIPDGEIIKNNFETSENNEKLFDAYGYGHITKYISKNMKNKYIISSYIDYTVLGRLPGRIESIQEISNSYLSAKTIQSYDDFKEYVQTRDTSGLLILGDDQTGFSEYVYRYVDECGYAEIVEDESSKLYVLR